MYRHCVSSSEIRSIHSSFFEVGEQTLHTIIRVVHAPHIVLNPWNSVLFCKIRGVYHLPSPSQELPSKPIAMRPSSDRTPTRTIC